MVLEGNFLELTNKQAIDYVNLGDFMRLVFQEFNKAFDSKKKDKNGDSEKKEKADEPLSND